ncbi:MAG: hypothetical protein LBN21_13475, partial [Treponema sp.]|nr:hypothetical protein [Treponema sp.]
MKYFKLSILLCVFLLVELGSCSPLFENQNRTGDIEYYSRTVSRQRDFGDGYFQPAEDRVFDKQGKLETIIRYSYAPQPDGEYLQSKVEYYQVHNDAEELSEYYELLYAPYPYYEGEEVFTQNLLMGIKFYDAAGIQIGGNAFAYRVEVKPPDPPDPVVPPVPVPPVVSFIYPGRMWNETASYYDDSIVSSCPPNLYTRFGEYFGAEPSPDPTWILGSNWTAYTGSLSLFQECTWENIHYA